MFSPAAHTPYFCAPFSADVGTAILGSQSLPQVPIFTTFDPTTLPKKSGKTLTNKSKTVGHGCRA
jgi:hypothetical protein